MGMGLSICRSIIASGPLWAERAECPGTGLFFTLLALVKLNCAAIPPVLLESELCGYERGEIFDAS
jgi:hypothetical protein